MMDHMLLLSSFCFGGGRESLRAGGGCISLQGYKFVKADDCWHDQLSLSSGCCGSCDTDEHALT